ncbi:energy-coupling factor ABC transporter ATP-binding protein [Rothia sp. ZJ1223]|uniref:energy-coupling factor ABC transporter ATP-binding protein n=1 Tax=Rothia sp. ZJ1223 TaxID=2811098 RepID=UPI001957FB88|nr:ABC transporter ATP-binding protein [Rothia sp. ZJ1223]MBM7050586.1 ABC transporter ATP-binding protein [Rothia sp. ZJ1223]
MRFFRTQKTPKPAPTFCQGAGIAFNAASFADALGQHTIIEALSLTLTAPSTALLGLNGSGKSSVLKLINGINTASSGSITVDGVEVAGNESAVRSRVGLLFSNPLAQLLMPTPVEDLELSLRSVITDATQRRTRALELLETRGLGDRAHSSVYDLSGGEQQLVALSAVLAVEPEILLLDEPTTLLDLRNRLRLFEVLDSLNQQLVMSTHDLELAARCDEAVVIHEGRLWCKGPTDAVIEQYRLWCAQGFPAEPVGEL